MGTAAWRLRGSDWLQRFVVSLGEINSAQWILAPFLILVIAVLDWRLAPNISLGALYIFPILVISGAANRWTIGLIAIVCALLQEGATHAPFGLETCVRVVTYAIAYGGPGLFVSELQRNNRLVAQHLAAEEKSLSLLKSAEQETHAILRATPLGMLTLDEEGRVLRANEWAHRLFGFDPAQLSGVKLEDYVPGLAQAIAPLDRMRIGGHIECLARRRDGEFLLAHVWLTTYAGGTGRRTAAVIWDGTDSLRDRQYSGHDSLMATSHALLGIVAHELRNFTAAARRSFARLAQLPEVAAEPEFHRLGTVLSGLESAAQPAQQVEADSDITTDLATVLYETRIMIEPDLKEAGIELHWGSGAGLPVVRCSQQGMVQVLLNLVRNSERALRDAAVKKIALTVAPDVEQGRVLLRLKDTGPGIARPEELFHIFPSAPGSGLGLSISRAILRSYGGELCYEPGEGACFVIELKLVESGVQ